MDSKKLGLIFISIFSLIFAIQFVSAQWYHNTNFFKGASETIIQWIKDIFGPFFEAIIGTSGFDEFFWAKILLLFLFFAVFYMTLKRVEAFKDREGIAALISIIITIFAVRYINNEGIIASILMPSGAMGISIMIFLPILIYFFFVHNAISSPIGRRAGWLVFSVVFLVLWLKRADRISSDMNWIYGVGVAVILINIIFDEGIHQYFGITQARAARRERIKLQISDIEEQLKRYRMVPNPSVAMRDTIEILERRLNKLYRQL